MELCPRCGAALPEGSRECKVCPVAESGLEDGLIDPPALPEEAPLDALPVTPPPGALPERWERLLATPTRRRVTRAALSAALVVVVLLVSVSAWSAFVHSAWGARLGGMNEVVFVGANTNPLNNGRASVIACITTVGSTDSGTQNGSDPTNCANRQKVTLQSGSAWTIDDASDSGLYLTRPDGTGLHRLTKAPRGTYFSPVWSPDGARIAAFIVQPGYVANLVIMDADGSNAHIISAVSLIIGAFFGGMSEVATPLAKLISWSPDSSRLVAPMGNSQFALLNADGSGLRQVSGDHPTWSPDGSSLAYYTHINPDGINPQEAGSDATDPSLRIAVLNVKTGQVHTLNHLANLSGGALAWSPDGRFLAYSSTSQDATQSLLSMSALMLARTDGSDPRMVAQWEGGYIEQITWSPDARQFAVVVGNVVLTNGDSGLTNQQSLWVVDSDQSHLRDLGPCNADAPSWSPDGRHLIFTNQIDAVHSSILIVADTGVSPVKEQKLDLHIPFAFAPSWSPLAGL
jgi:Tol biopolymer transport system component